MKIKLFSFVFTLAFISYAHGASKNLCDELAESGSSTPEQIKKCQEKMGVSDYAKEEIEKRRLQEESKKIADAASAANASQSAKKLENIETKKFSYEELLEAGFGKPFLAFTDDYRYGKFKQTRITEGDPLCSYLGFEKVVKSVVSQQLNLEESDRKGLIIDKNFLGFVKAPALYRQDDPKVGARKYLEITCVKSKTKSADGTSDAIKSVVENLVFKDENLIAEPKESSPKVFDKAREKKPDTTPHGFKTPDWMKSDTGSATGK